MNVRLNLSRTLKQAELKKIADEVTNEQLNFVNAPFFSPASLFIFVIAQSGGVDDWGDIVNTFETVDRKLEWREFSIFTDWITRANGYLQDTSDIQFLYDSILNFAEDLDY